MVVTPLRAGQFGLRFVQGFTPKVPRISEFAGQILKTTAGGWEGYVIPTAPSPDIRAAHVKTEFDGCDKVTSTI